MGWLTFGYFVSYIPYAMLVKALASGATPLSTQPVNGYELLPAAALGQLLAMAVFLGLTGRWRHMRRSEIGGRRIPVPGRETLASGFFASLIIGATTMNYTFSGVSILFMLLLMRGGVLVLSPLIDMAHKRRVMAYSWVGLCLSLIAVSVALGDVNSYHLTLAAVLSVLTYLVGYLGRFEIMSRVAKNGVVATDRRFFVEEHAAAPVCLALLLAAGALAGQSQLRAGFTTFLDTPAALAAAGIGVVYEVLFVFASLIYLDRREYTWGVPAWAFASLMSGLVASYALTWLAGLQSPGSSQLIALVFGVGAAAALSYPSAALWWRTRGAGAGCRVLFVCGGNTSRSPMAEVIAWAQAAEAGVAHVFRFSSAGVATTQPASPMTPDARSALADLGLQRVPGRGNPRRHRARPVTPELCRISFVIYCMTRAHRDRVIAMAPEAEGRALCLDPRCDIPNPEGQSPEVYRRCARHIQRSVRIRLRELLGPDGLAASLSDEGELRMTPGLRDGLSLITSRHCKRAFLDRVVPRDALAEIFLAAGHAPSSRNTQMWQVTVVTGSTLKALVDALCEAFDRGDPPRPDYANRPPYLDDVVECRAGRATSGVLLAKGHAAPDPAAARAHFRDNLRFYGAPTALVCHLPGNAVPGTFLEMGLFLQNVMLGLVAGGLSSCPQFSVAGYGDVLRLKLGIDADRLVVCTLAVGYADEAAPVNWFVPQRAGLEEYVQWRD